MCNHGVFCNHKSLLTKKVMKHKKQFLKDLVLYICKRFMETCDKYLVTEVSVVWQCLHVVFHYNSILVEEMLLAMVTKTMKLHVWSHLVSIATM